MKYLYMFSGRTTYSDKVRGIDTGDDDMQAIISSKSDDPRKRCTLDEAVFMSMRLLNEDWQTK